MGRGAAVLVLVVLLLIGCADGRKKPASVPPPAGRNGAGPLTYVSIGSSETNGAGLDFPERVRAAWPQLVLGHALPAGSVLVNVSRDDATVANARAEQVPLALEQRPTLVTVWLGAADEDAGTSSESFGRDLTALLTTVRRNGATKVLVAQPATGAAGSRYGAQISSAAQGSGAEIILLPPTAAPGSDKDSVIAAQAAVADAFGRALTP